MNALNSFQIQLFALAVMGVACGTASAQERLKVGEKFAIHVDSGRSSDVEGIPTERGEVYTISHPGATYIAIHFKKFHLPPGASLIVTDADGGQIYVLEGKGKMNAGKFWSQHVKGDTIVLELVGAAKQPGKGFVIDEYAAGFVNFGSVTARICGVDDFENAICRSPSVEYDRAQAVARLLIQGAFLCTGWLASADDHFITNEHCITTSDEALNTDYEFGAEAPNCGDNNCQLCFPGIIYSGASFIQDSPGLDYALIQLAGNPSDTWGFLQIDNRQAIVGEQIYLISHPAGRAKEFAYNSSEDVGGLATVQSVTEPTCSGATLEVGYWADTLGGSSGSPVLAVSSQKVIALHHCHNSCDHRSPRFQNPNRGVPIDLICAEICGLLGPECVGDTDCDDGNACNGSETCVGGSCQAGTPVNCDDSNACTSDSCNTGTGACLNDPISCDDGDACTTDTCDPGSGCVNTDPPCQDGDGCCPAGCDNTNDNDCLSCAPVGGSCTVDGDCCTNKCRGPRGRKTCK